MNVIAVDIGNTNIDIGLFLNDQEKFVETVPGDSGQHLAGVLKSAWDKIPVAKSSKEKKRNGVIVVSSVKEQWMKLVRKIAKDSLGERIYVIGKNIPLPMKTAIDEPDKVGTDRIVSAAAAYDVVGDFVVVADFGSAITIDLVDTDGVFLGGVICPGFDMSATVLGQNTSQLPKVKVKRPKTVYGKNTREAIECGLYYSALGTLQEVVRRYAEKIGRWPQTVITGAAAKIIKDDCNFIDNYVPNLVVKGIVLTYQKYIESKSQ